MTWEDAPLHGTSAGERAALWRRYKLTREDERTRERLLLAYIPLVQYVAGRVSPGLPACVERDDVISYGQIGLINAFERFDPDGGVPFEGYAMTRVKGAVFDELGALDWAPRFARALARRIERTHAELAHRLQRQPTEVELADELGLSSAEFQDSLDEPAIARDDLWAVSGATGEPESLLDALLYAVPDPGHLGREAAESDLRDRLARAVSALPQRHKLVIGLRYDEHMTLREIGEVAGMSEADVSELHARAVRQLTASVRT